MSASAAMCVASELARQSIAEGGGPFGAVVVRERRIVGRGLNRVVLTRDPTAHAEIVALAAQELGTHELTGCELFSSCEPCPMCLGAIHWARIARVHFACDRHDAAAAGFDDLAFYAELAGPLGERVLPLLADGRELGLTVFRAWLAKPDRRPH